MAYTMGDVMGGGSLLEDLEGWTATPLKGMAKFGNELKKIGASLSKGLAPHVTKSAKAIEKAHKDKDKVKSMTSMFSTIGGMMTGPVGIIIALLDKLGVVEPIMSVLNGLMQIFSGTLMELLMPAFQELFDILLSEETIALVVLLAEIFAMFLIPMIQIFSKILLVMIPIFMHLLNIFRGPLAAILPILAKAIGILLMGAFIQLITGIWLVGAAIAAIVGFITGTDALDKWNAMILPSLMSMMSALPEIASMQHGGYVPATTGGQIIRVSEGGEGEHITPESQMKEVIWATEDNGNKLDKIYQALVNKGRLI